MKNLSLKLSGFALMAFLFVFSACNDDPCKDVDCGDFGTCFEGDCNCLTGYEGTMCDIEWSAKFVGSFIGQDACTSGNYGPIASNITSTSSTAISISNFAGFAAAMSAVVETPTKIVINNPNFVSPDGTFTVNGNGEISGNTLTITYNSVNQGNGETDSCTLTYTKQ